MSAPSDGLGSDERLFPGRRFISTVLDLLDVKSEMSARLWKVYLMRAAMAGIVIGLFYLAYYAVLAAFDAVATGGGSTLLPIGKMVGAIVFGFALVLIYYTKSELLTTNMMVGSVGVYYRRASRLRVLRIFLLCYLGNIIGGLLIALLLLGSSLVEGPVADQMASSVATKTGYVTDGLAGMGDLLVRAILCNLLINIAMLVVYNGMVTEDLAKIAAMVMAVLLFMFLGLEHSVANTVLFLIYGFQYDIGIGAALGNLAICLFGNFIGGGLLIGVYYAYANDPRRIQRRLTHHEE